MALFINCFCAMFGALLGAGLAVCVVSIVAWFVNIMLDR